jgi:hypothetical protein
MLTERAYAIAAVETLQSLGWSLVFAWDGGEGLCNPETAAAAVDWVRAAEQGNIHLMHPEKGRLGLALLFQNGPAEEVIYDTSAPSDATLDEVDGHLRRMEVRLGLRLSAY